MNSCVDRLTIPFAVLIVCLSQLVLEMEKAAGADPPNFIIIMADDLGYGDIGCYGNNRIQTPHLDRLAQQGIRFVDFHASGPVCSPTRCGLMTGRYQQRAGIPAVVSVKHKHLGMSRGETTFAEVLKEAGYRTALFGKWHLGYEKKFNPVHQGFDRFRGYVSGNIDFFSHVDQSGAYDWWNADEQVEENGYTTHLITRHAVDFIKENRQHPFCLYLAHEAPHYPYQGPNDSPDRIVGGRFQNQGSRKDVQQAYREMVEEMDKGIGEVLAELKRNDLDSNTLVWFFSDNGANRHGSNGKFRGYKGSLWEGGHRVPSIARWKGKIGANSTSSSLATTLDVFPTLISLANSENKNQRKLDGSDLTRVLLEKKALVNRTMFWGFQKQRAMRQGKWKLISKSPGQKKGTELYDLAKDPGESNDLSQRFPDRVTEMKNAIRAWEEEVGPSEFKPSK